MLSKKILSLQHDIVKRARKLREKSSFRKDERATILSGEKILRDLSSHLHITRLFSLEGKTPLSLPADETIEVPLHILQKITGHPSPDGYAAEVTLPQEAPIIGNRFLALDGIQDPSNLGAIFRSAQAFNIDMLLLLPECADPFHERAIQSGRGAQFTLPFAYVEKLPEYPVYGAAIDGIPLNTFVPPKQYILVLGNEGHGLSPEIETGSKKIAIPIQGIESLNVAVAAGIFLYALTKEP